MGAIDIREKAKSGYLVALLGALGAVSGVTAILIAYPALAFLASRIG